MSNPWLDTLRNWSPYKRKFFSFKLYAAPFHSSSAVLSPIPFAQFLVIKHLFLKQQDFFFTVGFFDSFATFQLKKKKKKLIPVLNHIAHVCSHWSFKKKPLGTALPFHSSREREEAVLINLENCSNWSANNAICAQTSLLQMKDKLQPYYCKFYFSFFKPIKLESIYSNNTFEPWYNKSSIQ